jgi:hypothetical protein
MWRTSSARRKCRRPCVCPVDAGRVFEGPAMELFLKRCEGMPPLGQRTVDHKNCAMFWLPRQVSSDMQAFGGFPHSCWYWCGPPYLSRVEHADRAEALKGRSRLVHISRRPARRDPSTQMRHNANLGPWRLCVVEAQKYEASRGLPMCPRLRPRAALFTARFCD